MGRSALGESNTLIILLTKDLGLIRARAQGLRKPSAKLSSALITLAESNVTLVRGKDGWRITGATLSCQWHRLLPSVGRVRTSRLVGLMLRLVAGETQDTYLFPLFKGFLETLNTPHHPDLHDAAECVAILKLLSILGLDQDVHISSTASLYDSQILKDVAKERSLYIERINHGIEMSGL